MQGDVQSFYISAHAVAPLLVRVELGATCGSQCDGKLGSSMGQVQYFAWLPGVHQQLSSKREWSS